MTNELSVNDLKEVAGGTAVQNQYYNVIPAGWSPYKIKKGDVLYNLARKRGTTVEKVLMKNPLLTNPNVISIGYLILLPTSD